MRKPKVVIFNYNVSFVHDLVAFFRNRGYDICVLAEYVNAICPIYGKQENKPVPSPFSVVTSWLSLKMVNG